MKPVNPFILTGYLSPEYFCDREQESRKLISALRNGRNITLVSPRRMGKTGLIRHVFHSMSTEKDTMCYYVDLYQTHNLASFVKKFSETVLGTLDTKEEKIIKNVFTFFKSLRPVVTMDPMTGEPGFTVDIKPEMAETSLQEVFAYMEHSGKRCYVSFDEFQVVADYDDKNVEALLRSHIQHLTAVNFIFSGSQRHVLENMFVSASRPFYQSAQLMYLDCIDRDAYYQFAKTKFAENNQVIERDAFDYAYRTLYGHTWYVQMLLNRLHETGIDVLTVNAIDSMLHDITLENEATYQTFLRLITSSQGRLLKAISEEGSVREVLSQQFIHKYHLGATSTVKSAVKALVDKELILISDEEYQVYDRFFMLWLCQR